MLSKVRDLRRSGSKKAREDGAIVFVERIFLYSSACRLIIPIRGRRGNESRCRFTNIEKLLRDRPLSDAWFGLVVSWFGPRLGAVVAIVGGIDLCP